MDTSSYGMGNPQDREILGKSMGKCPMKHGKTHHVQGGAPQLVISPLAIDISPINHIY